MWRAPTLTFWCANRASSFARVLEPQSPCSKRAPLPVHGLCKPVTFAGEDHNMAVVDQSVNQSCRQPVVSKDGVPLRKLQIGSNNEALAFVAVRDYLEKQLCCILVQGNETNLINHNQFGLF